MDLIASSFTASRWSCPLILEYVLAIGTPHWIFSSNGSFVFLDFISVIFFTIIKTLYYMCCVHRRRAMMKLQRRLMIALSPVSRLLHSQLTILLVQPVTARQIRSHLRCHNHLGQLPLKVHHWTWETKSLTHQVSLTDSKVSIMHNIIK